MSSIKELKEKQSEIVSKLLSTDSLTKRHKSLVSLQKAEGKIKSKIDKEINAMKQKELLARGLPKWSGMVVVGESVSKEQAMEINIRTTDFSYLTTNNHSLRNKLYSYLYKVNPMNMPEHCHTAYDIFKSNWQKADEENAKLYARIGSIADKINHLRNENVVSCWIDGPHGWCKWNGEIFTNEYNIGKYPDCESVYEEWKIIAKTFPYLNLSCQLFDKETCEDNANPVIEYVIKNGKVRVKNPTKVLTVPTKDRKWPERDYNNLEAFEAGITFQAFKEAFEYVERGCKYDDNSDEELNR